MIHCQKCHVEHDIGYCCYCNKQYPTLEGHCCHCQIWTNKNYEKHCCLCSSNHRLDYCCFCKISWNIRTEEHCCKCKTNYPKYIINKCHSSSDLLPTNISSEYDNISERSYTMA
jgi:hypothetical protein